MSLDLGALFATVEIIDAPFQRTYTRLIGQLQNLEKSGARSAGGVRTLDASLVGVGSAADKATAGMTRATRATSAQATAQQKATSVAARHAEATSAVGMVMERTAGMTTRERQAVLLLTSAQDRLNAVQTGGVATTRSLASAQAGLLAAQRRVESSQVAMASRMTATGKKMSHAITLPVLALGAVSVHEAMQWQKSMTLIQTAGGETAAKAAALSKGLMKISTETGTSLDQLGEGIYTIAKAGAQKWSATDQLLVMKAAAQGAKAEQVDLGVATDALSTVMLDYHLSASKAVATENQLIRASGLAKTNFADFSRSLSNVMPIASALGIKQAEILGGLATMTQHGVSPQQASENMRNLLFNLAGQNNVASQAMQQLGINTVDLTKSLSTRGLTGTLAIVDKALAAHTKNGMVVVDVHKAAALATGSLNKMLGDMGGKLKNQSAGLISGKVSIADYTKYAKSLGGQAGASALQFKSLFLNSEGFSNQLKSGKGTLTTSTAQYAKLLGGMTGAGVAMQIGGKYAADNARNVREVGKAALEAGSDVLGWNKTQDTLAVKMDKAKASLQVMSVEIGTALIPTVGKLVSVGQKAGHWFDGLSHSQREVLGWSVGVLAAIGPVMAIGGRLALLGRGIGTFVGGASRQLATFAGASEANALRISSAMTRVSGAIGGAAIGVAIGSLTRNSSDGVKAIGALGAAAAGAAFGAAGGPLGMAIGGAAGLVGDLATQFLSAGSAANTGAAMARAALERQKADAEDLLSTLKSVNGAYGAQYREQTVVHLQKAGALDNAAAAGVAPKTITNAALGDPAAIAALAKRSRALLAGTTKGGVTTFDTKAQSALQGILNALAEVSPAARKAEHSYELYLAGLGRGVVSQKALAGGLKNLTGELKGTGVALMTSASAEAAHSAFAARNTEVIKENIDALGVVASKQVAAGKSAVHAAAGFYAGESALRKQLIALGFAAPAVDKLIGTYHRLPKSVVTALKKTGVTPGEIQHIADKYHGIPKGWITAVTKRGVTPGQIQAITDKWLGLKAHPNANLHVSSNIPAVYNSLTSLYGAIMHPPSAPAVTIPAVRIPGVTLPGLIGGKATGTGTDGLPEGVSAVGEEGPELAIKRGDHVDILSNRQSKRYLALTGLRAPGFAGGTVTAGKGGATGVAEVIAGQTGTAASAMRLLSKAVNDAFQLKGIEKSIDAVKAKLVSMKEYRSGITSTLAGAFDPTKYGSVTDLISGLGGAASTNRAYSSELTNLRARSKGNKTLTAFINELAASGQTATLQTLAGASKSQLAQVSKSVGGYQSSLSIGGNAAVLEKYGTSIHAQEVREARLDRQRRDEVRNIDKLVAAIAHLTKRPVEVKIGDKVVARAVIHSKEFAGVLDELSHTLHYGSN